MQNGESAPIVLVVGAGPVGLAMAAELARHGVACRVVDQNEAPTDKSKAIAVHARTLELLDAIGLADRALAAGKTMHGTNFYQGGRRIVHVSFDDLDSAYPFVLSLPQSETERLLAEHLEGLGVKVERRTKLARFAQDEQGVTATLARDGVEEDARVAYLVGCDGAHSAVRHALGLSFEGAAYEEGFALADVLVDTSWPDDEMHMFLAPDGLLAAFPLPGAHRWRLIASFDGQGDPTLDAFQDLVRRRAGPEPRLREPRWLAAFKVHRRIVPRYREGRVFVAGDAAHIHSPAGGQGMNTGIQDACNLAWKLALVARGKGRPALLDSYDAERRPIAATTLTGTDLATRAVTLRSPIAREARNQLMQLLTSIEAVQKQIIRTAAQVALSYRKSPIVREDRIAMVHASVVANRATEQPSLSDWLDFGAAAHAGDRAPDATIDEDGERKLHELFRSPRHVLLLFDGAAATVEGYVRLDNIGRRVRERYASLVDVHVVVPHPSKPPELAWDGSLVLDAQGALHHRYGAASECLYLVRPDGYVAYRAQPADEERLMRYLATIFT